MHKERQAALLVILGILVIFCIGLGVLWFVGSRTNALRAPVPAVSDTSGAEPVASTTFPVAPSGSGTSFGGHPIRLELATTTAEQEQGLGNRSNVPDGYGMLFVFAADGNYGFWMKDMEASLDMFWLSDSGAVVTMKTDIAPSTYPNVFYPSTPARYVLETRAGYAAANGIHVGSTLSGLPSSLTVSK